MTGSVMNDRYAVVKAERERTVFTIEMLRVIADDREREFQAEARRRQVVAPSIDKVRWHHRTAQPRPKEAMAR